MANTKRKNPEIFRFRGKFCSKLVKFSAWITPEPENINVLFGTFLRFAPKNSLNKRFSDVFAERIDVLQTTTKTVSVSYLFLADGIPGLSTATGNQEAVFESPQTQIH